jgi:NAD(P)-dependent dehydrogenase (short-subunit alcohol dehydrogenase family)
MATTEQQFPPQRQAQPGHESKMHPQPIEDDERYVPSGKLKGKVALITGGDSGIGRAVAILYAKEGARVAISYLDEHEDAKATQEAVQKYGGSAITIAGDIGDENVCQWIVEQTLKAFGRIDILVNHAGEQHLVKDVAEISAEQLERTFRTNVFSMFYLIKATLPHLKQGSSIINTTSVQAYAPAEPGLIDYAASKAAIVGLTRSLSQSLIRKGIRVNAVAPGPVWTPLIPATMPDKVETFGKQVPMQRAAQPVEIAPCYLFLAAQDSSYIAGQVLHPNGGTLVDS